MPSNIIRTLIVDDEPLARAELQRLLSKYPQLDIVAEAENVEDALEKIEAHDPQVIFTDIEMPGGTGVELAEELGGSIPLVFCTAYNEFAVDAFSLNAVDYLLKPISKLRLDKAIEKLLPLIEENSSTYLDDDFKLMVKFGETMRIVQLKEIIRFESVGNHVAIYTQHGKAYLHSSLTKIEARLPEEGYLRASRSDIVRLDAIAEMEETINYGLLATLNNGAEVEISRRQASKLKKQMSFL